MFLGKYIDNPEQRKGRAGISFFILSLALVILNLEALLSELKKLNIAPGISVAIFFLIIFAPISIYIIWARTSQSETLWSKGKDWTLYFLFGAIPISFGLLILRAKRLI